MSATAETDYEMFDATGNRWVAAAVRKVADAAIGKRPGDVLAGTAAGLLRAKRKAIEVKKPEVNDTAVREAIWHGLGRELETRGLPPEEAKRTADRIMELAA